MIPSLPAAGGYSQTQHIQQQQLKDRTQIMALIQYYLQQASNAQTATDAQYFQSKAAAIIQSNGIPQNALGNTPAALLNGIQGATAQGGGAKPGMAPIQGGKQGDTGNSQAIVKDLRTEFNLREQKADWAERAKTDDNITIFDKDGNNKDAAGKIDKGDIIEVKSQKHGVVRIQVGGDGVINGGDDKIISIGGQAATGSIGAGLNQLNAGGTGTPAANNTTVGYPNAAKAIGNPAAPQVAQSLNPMFSSDELRNLLAAIFYVAMQSPEQQRVLY